MCAPEPPDGLMEESSGKDGQQQKSSEVREGGQKRYDFSSIYSKGESSRCSGRLQWLRCQGIGPPEVKLWWSRPASWNIWPLQPCINICSDETDWGPDFWQTISLFQLLQMFHFCVVHQVLPVNHEKVFLSSVVCRPASSCRRWAGHQGLPAGAVEHLVDVYLQIKPEELQGSHLLRTIITLKCLYMSKCAGSVQVLDFHHPHQLRDGLEGFSLDLPDRPETLEQILVDCRDTLKYGVKTGASGSFMTSFMT